MKIIINRAEGRPRLKDEIAAALGRAGLETEQERDKQQVLQRIQEKFIKGPSKVWWVSLDRPWKTYNFPDNSGHLHIGRIVPGSGAVWLVTSEINEDKLVFSVPLHKIASVLGNCRLFEYYLVDKELTWILSENFRGEIQLTRA
ncbi:MAG: hypothetical protein ACN6QH_23600 [Pseudomonas sp.]|uniref:hypothetical protein n=1 Tax=Pseudomonas sp. TaxID=306 RepID=UPI003D1451CA